MNNVLLMQPNHNINQLQKQPLDKHFVHSLAWAEIAVQFFNVIIQLATIYMLQHQAKVMFRLHGAVQLNYVWMINVLFLQKKQSGHYHRNNSSGEIAMPDGISIYLQNGDFAVYT